MNPPPAMRHRDPEIERLATRIILALWRAGENSSAPEIPATRLAAESGATPVQLGEALRLLSARECLIEQTPSGIQLISAGLTFWREILEDFSRRHHLSLGHRVQVFAKTTSSSDIAWKAAAENHDETGGLVVLADQQTQGRGRLGHSWHAAAGQSVLMSILLCSPPADGLDRLTLLAGLATAIAIEHAAAHAGSAAMPPVEIHWPNDLFIRDKKIAGILVERRPAPPPASRAADGSRNAPAVIGIGINAAQSAGDFPPELQHRAISLFQSAGTLIDRLRLIACVLAELDTHLGEPPESTAWLEKWKQRCPFLGKPIRARVGNTEVAGQVLDIDPLHGLLIRDSAGATHLLSAQTATLLPREK